MTADHRSMQGRRKLRKVGGGEAGFEGHFKKKRALKKKILATSIYHLGGQKFFRTYHIFPKYEKMFSEIPLNFPDI